MTVDTLHTLSSVLGSLLPWELYLLSCLDGDLTDLEEALGKHGFGMLLYTVL